ncbi:MAG: IPT/TIG domain-containing protein [Tannerella sp.]|jgi:outer membrane protein assembly factor BamB|nr:IPT/TIG domain-containing protein [Tannerella sp.]
MTDKTVNYLKGKVAIFAVGMALTVMCFHSCEDNSNNNFDGTPYDPSKPVTLESFEPDSGGMATKVFINGKNFGTDLTQIKVYFNDLRAPVVGSDGEHIYAITPRQPGRECTISVVVNNDSVSFTNKTYLYRTLTTVTTIAGKKGTTEFKPGTLAEATFDHPSTLCVDREGNIFLSHWRVPYTFVLINQENDLVQELPVNNEPLGAPTPDSDGKVISAPTDGGDGYFSFDPDAQWAPKRRLILHPNEELIAGGMLDFSINYKHGMSACLANGYIYTRSYNGQLVRFNPITRSGERVGTLLLEPSTDAFMTFDPYKHEILYISYPSRHCIYTFNINTGEHTLFAGTRGTAGWKDGERLQSEFNNPVQVTVDQDGSVIVADMNNHCIRKISPDGMVSTVIGKGTVAGYVDGNPEDALFNHPKGVAIDKDFNIYVADYDNNVVRKLAIE